MAKRLRWIAQQRRINLPGQLDLPFDTRPRQRAKRGYIEPENLEYIRENHNRISLIRIAAHVGRCPDTVRRIMVREGIADFDGAKYVAAPKQNLWARPCMKCKSTTPRPRNQYICDDCSRSLDDGGYDDA